MNKEQFEAMLKAPSVEVLKEWFEPHKNFAPDLLLRHMKLKLRRESAWGFITALSTVFITCPDGRTYDFQELDAKTPEPLQEPPMNVRRARYGDYWQLPDGKVAKLTGILVFFEEDPKHWVDMRGLQDKDGGPFDNVAVGDGVKTSWLWQNKPNNTFTISKLLCTFNNGNIPYKLEDLVVADCAVAQECRSAEYDGKRKELVEKLERTQRELAELDQKWQEMNNS